MRVVSQTLGLFKWVRLPLLGMTILAGMKGNMETLVHVSRAVGASADVTVAVSDLAVQVLNRTSSGIAVVSTMVWAATSSSLGAVEAGWHGLDLLNVKISRSRGRVQASSPKMLRRWLNSSTGQRVTLCRDAEVLQVWQDGLQSLQNGLPNLSHERDFLQIQGSFKRIAFQASWAGPDEAWMHYDVVGAAFSPRWANPLWTFAELSWESESRQIANLITELIHQLPSTQLVDHRVADADVALSAKELWAAQHEQAHRAVSVLVAYCCFRWRLFWYRFYRGWGLWLLALGSVLFLGCYFFFQWGGWSKIQSWWRIGRGWCWKRLGLVATDWVVIEETPQGAGSTSPSE